MPEINWTDTKIVPISKKDSHDGGNNSGGGGGVPNYVTKDELNSAVDRISQQMDNNHRELLTKFELVNQKMDHIEQMVDLKLDNQKESVNKIDNRLSTIIGIGVTSIIIPVLLKLLGY